MDQQEKIARVARQVGSALRRQAHDRWETVRLADRTEDGRHVWRFKSGPDQTDRFLHVTHDAMANDTAPLLLRQLEAGRWLDRLNDGPETALILSQGGRLEAWKKH